MFKDFKSLIDINWVYFFLLLIIFWVGEINLYSAANGNFEPWAYNQFKRFLLFLPIFFFILMLQPRFIFNITEIILICIVIGLIITLFFGYAGMGAKRWIRIGGFNLQISEFAKIALVLFMAKYFHRLNAEKTIGLFRSIVPLIISLLFFLLVAIQPDLGTAIIILTLGLIAIFYAGINLIYPLLSLIVLGLASPFLWTLLKPYQQNRVMIFLNPDLDPLGKGYHIIQSKIAIGSGGIRGNGFLGGSQSSLDFLPEKETDFVFAIFSEQFGFTGSMIILGLFLLFFLVPILKSFSLTQVFNKLILFVLSFKIFFEFLINISMTIGLVPVVGVALPFMSYGGSSLLSNMIICALLMNFMSISEKKRMFS
ncbi:MAG: rod shape-determining protein RodA [Alphaproteobacteria bacterium]|nr:rod shape-determining protein RodA [Alphaproteobacteria bacterium]